MADWPPIVRNSDPSTSHVAAARIEPKRGTRRARVLDLLRLRPGAWVPGHSLTAPDVGGSEGLRRLRELRQLGWPIERRPDRSPSATGWEYRMAPDPHVPPGGPTDEQITSPPPAEPHPDLLRIYAEGGPPPETLF